MTQMQNVPRDEWRPFFDRMSQGLLGKWAEVEAASLDLGDQIVAEWVPLLGITYDSNDDLVDVALDRANHLIRRPRQIMVEEADGGLKSVTVLDAGYMVADEQVSLAVRRRTPADRPSPPTNASDRSHE